MPVGSADDEDVLVGSGGTAGGLQTVDFGEELGDDSIHDASGVTCDSTCGRQRIQFVEEQDTRPRSPRPCKHLPHLPPHHPDQHFCASLVQIQALDASISVRQLSHPEHANHTKRTGLGGKEFHFVRQLTYPQPLGKNRPCGGQQISAPIVMAFFMKSEGQPKAANEFQSPSGYPRPRKALTLCASRTCDNLGAMLDSNAPWKDRFSNCVCLYGGYDLPDDAGHSLLRPRRLIQVR